MSHKLQPGLLGWGNRTVGSSIAARYLSPGFESSSALIVPIELRLIRPGLIRSLRVNHGEPSVPAAVGDLVYTFLLDGADTPLTCNVAKTADTGSDLDPTHGVAVAANQRVSMRLTKTSATGQPPKNITVTVEYV